MMIGTCSASIGHLKYTTHFILKQKIMNIQIKRRQGIEKNSFRYNILSTRAATIRASFSRWHSVRTKVNRPSCRASSPWRRAAWWSSSSASALPWLLNLLIRQRLTTGSLLLSHSSGFFFGFTQVVDLVQVNLAGSGAVGPGLLSEDHLPLAVDQVQDGVAECREVVGYPELPYPLLLSHHHTQLTQESFSSSGIT